MKKSIKTIWLILLSVCTAEIAANGQITGIKIVGDTCSNLTLDLQALGTSSSPYFAWNFGDPASGADNDTTLSGANHAPFPTHTFSAPGVYTVCVSFQEPGTLVSTVCRTISIGLCCSGFIQGGDSCLQNNSAFALVTAAVPNSIAWNFGDPASGAANSSTENLPSHRFSAAGNYLITTTATAPCGSFTATYPITIVSCAPAAPCTGTILVNDTCSTTDAFFNINATAAVRTTTWDFGDPLSGASNVSSLAAPSHTFSGAGSFTVQAIVNFNCGADTLTTTIQIVDCDSAAQDCKVFIPSAFTPNGDGINESFAPRINCPTEQYECMVFNRWGGLVFKTTNRLDKWRGETTTAACPSGVYVYSVKYKFGAQPLKTLGGTVTLIR